MAGRVHVGRTYRAKCSSQGAPPVLARAGHVDHYQATNSDSGWGCGWRNIQMLSSHLVQRDEVRA